MSRETLPSHRPPRPRPSSDGPNEGTHDGPSGEWAVAADRARSRTSDTLLPPAPEDTQPVNPRPETSVVQRPAPPSAAQRFSGTVPTLRGLAPPKYPSQPTLPASRRPASLSAPSSIRPSATTVPPRAGVRPKDELGWLASTFWGALALAFGASAAAVYWELAEEPAHRSAELTPPSIAAAPSWATMSPMERRRHERLTEWLPVRLESGEAGLAVTHNVSETGALLVTAQELAVGQRVHITVPVPEQALHSTSVPQIELSAEVVRVAPNEEDPQGLWPYSVAVEFSEPSPALEAVLRAIAH